MALSTTIPMASTSANKVIRLMLIPKAFMNTNAPINETGTASIGIIVERQSPKKINTTKATSKNASNKVCNTFSIEASTNLDTS